MNINFGSQSAFAAMSNKVRPATAMQTNATHPGHAVAMQAAHPHTKTVIAPSADKVTFKGSCCG